MAKLGPDVIFSSGSPSGPAGGALTGVYPNPGIANNAITTSKIVDGSVTAIKLAPGVIPTSLPPSGNAGGDLIGVYPNPTIANNAITTIKLSDNSITTSKIVDASVTAVKLAPGVIPTSLPPSGNAGGDLIGVYPNPTIANNAITTIKLSDNSITTSKIVDASVTAVKLAPGVIPTSLPPSGNAGGDLIGVYPNPTIANNAITTIKLSDNSIATSKIIDGSVTAVKLAPGVIPTSLPPSGNAGGDLIGVYPNPTIANNAITTIKLSDNSITTAKIVDASVTNPKLADGAVSTSKIIDNAITTSKILDASVTMAKLGPDVILGSGGPPTGPAGGDLNGSYPNPNIAAQAVTISKIANGAVITPKIADGAVTTQKIADNSITTAKVVDASITMAKLGPDVILGSGGPPSGPAGGELTGTYPNPSIGNLVITTAKLADNSVTTSKIVDASVTAVKLAPGVIPTSLPPSGNAGGDLIGVYPNPTIANNAITTTKLSDNSISTSKIIDASVTAVKLAPGVIPTSLPPSGNAGGDLIGVYPNPTIANNAITTTKLSDNSISTSKIIDASVTAVKLAPGVIPTSLPPSGNAGGDLTGIYPNPTIINNAITTAKLSDNSVTTIKLADGSVTNLKLADNSVGTSKIIDASVTAVKLAPGVIPTSLPPNGTASGDLTGSYPAPVVSKIQGINVSNTLPLSGQVLKYNGTQWLPATDNSGGMTLPYSAIDNNAVNLFSISNQGSGAALEGINTSTAANTIGIVGKISSATAGTSSTALRGIHNGTGVNGYGVWGSHNGYGIGIYGTSVNGNGIQGSSTNGNGLFGTSVNGSAGYFDISNALSSYDAVSVYTVGLGSGMTAISEQGNGLWGITYSGSSAGVLGYNSGGGEGIVGRTVSNTAAAIVGKNDGTYAGVQGIGYNDNAVGVHAIVNQDGFVNGNALVAEVDGSGNGNPAVFKANGAKVARIDKTGKGFFNGGTQVGGADIAEMFDVEGDRKDYEPGDVLVISTSSDRKVERSTSAYSTLVAGVFATKPGVMLTEQNAEANDLDKLVPMGVIGVIPVKVCLEGGAIKRGDLIVTSSLTGVAMKADPDKIKPGQLIGKALQDYNADGIGKINVLVSIK